MKLELQQHYAVMIVGVLLISFTGCMAQDASRCTLSPEDVAELYALHRDALASVPSSIPAAEEIRRRMPETLAGRTVQCIAAGPFRIIYKPSSKFILDSRYPKGI